MRSRGLLIGLVLTQLVAASVGPEVTLCRLADGCMQLALPHPLGWVEGHGAKAAHHHHHATALADCGDGHGVCGASVPCTGDRHDGAADELPCAVTHQQPLSDGGDGPLPSVQLQPSCSPCADVALTVPLWSADSRVVLPLIAIVWAPLGCITAGPHTGRTIAVGRSAPPALASARRTILRT